MAFQVSTEINPETHHARLTVTFDAETFEKAKRKAARELSKRIKIPGFRPGKAPYAMIVRRVGEGTIIEEALDDLLEAHYGQILEQADIEPAAPGQLQEVASLDPLTLVIEVPLAPEVELGDYTDLRVPYEPPQVDEAQVEQALENLRRVYISIEPVDRPAQMGDVVVMDLRTTLYPPEGEEGEPQTIEEGETALLVKEADDPEEWPFPGFGKALEGVQAGDEKTLEYTYPADHPDESLRGRKAVYHLTVKEVQAPVLPDLTDEFVQENTEFETVDELRAALRQDLEARAQREYEDEYFRQVVQALIERSTLKIPQAMIEDEMASLRHGIDVQMQQAGTTLEQVLAQTGKDKDEFEAELREAAVRNLQQRLVLAELARRENLDLSEDEIQAAINEALTDLVRSEGQQGLRRLARDERALQQYVSNALSARTFAKAAQHLMRIARGDLETEAEAEAEAQGTDEAKAEAATEAETAAEAEAEAGAPAEPAAEVENEAETASEPEPETEAEADTQA